MDRTERESRQDGVSLARRYLRLQEIGLAFLCAWPVAMQIAAMYGLGLIIPQISALMLMAAVVFFAIGHVGRQELRDKENETIPRK